MSKQETYQYDITGIVGRLASHPAEFGIVVAPSVAAAKDLMLTVSSSLAMMECSHVTLLSNLTIQLPNGAEARFAGGDPDGLRGMGPAWVYCMDSDLFKPSRWEEVHQLVKVFVVAGADVMYA
jgi:hypothetical protein